MIPIYKYSWINVPDDEKEGFKRSCEKISNTNKKNRVTYQNAISSDVWHIQKAYPRGPPDP